MNFSDISFFKKKSEESDSKTEKDIKIMNLNVKNISKNNDLILSLKRLSNINFFKCNGIIFFI